MTPPVVTCVIPVYNGQRYLAATIDSVLAQTHGALDVVVVDDGSTDGSRAVAEAFGEPVRTIAQANAGPAAARNTGIAAGRGELIAILDADDLWLPEKLERQIAFLEANGHGATFTLIQNFWIESLAEEAERFRDHRVAQPLPGYVSSTLLARREAFDRVGVFDPARGHGEVQDWILRAREADVSIGLLPEVLTRRRLHESNRSRELQAQSREEFLQLVKAKLDRGRGR